MEPVLLLLVVGLLLVILTAGIPFKIGVACLVLALVLAIWPYLRGSRRIG